MKPTFAGIASLTTVLCVAAVSTVASGDGPNSIVEAASAPIEILQRLRVGGYTIHFRHAATDGSQNDEPTATGSTACAERGECGACTQQRNLSQAGREQARQIGAAIRSLDIPVATVLASPLCRAMESANLMFGRAQSAPDVRGGGIGRPSYPGLLRLISTTVPAGANQVVVGHGEQFAALAGAAYHLDMGEAAVIKGAGDGKYEIIARIRSEDWDKLNAVAPR